MKSNQSMMQELMQTKKRPSSSKINSNQDVSTALSDTRSCKPKRIKTELTIIQHAEEIQSKLGVNSCSFVKPMLKSHVSGGFWLGLPKKFCQKYLPKDDETVVLVDECDNRYETKYSAAKTGLSGGWRGFSVAHKLVVQDVLVFDLTGPCIFKVYIVRADGSPEVEGAFTLMTLGSSTTITNFEKEVNAHNEGENGLTLLSNASLEPLPENSRNLENHIEISTEIFNNIKFEEVNGIENFRILINGQTIDSEVTDNFREKYYELCCSQKSFLHDNLIKGIECKLAAAIIRRTVNIADAVRACKPNTSPDDISEWAKYLKAFEQMGMNVGFVLTRLNHVWELCTISREASEMKRREEDGLDRVQKELRLLEEKVKEKKEVMKRHCAEIEAVKMNAERIEAAFNEVVKLPW